MLYTAGVDSDFELLDAWKDGDRSAGDALVQRHFDTVFRFLSRKTTDDVSDLVQQIFLKCVESRDRFRKQASFKTYLLAIAKHELYAFWRKRKRDQALDFSASSLADLDPRPSTLAAEKREQRLLLEAIRSIPLDLQIALELHYWEEMTGPELAEVLEVPEGTVRSRLRRAREALHRRMTELAQAGDPMLSTLDDLDRWAASLKSIVDEAGVGAT